MPLATNFIREYKHALAQDFTKDSEPAAYAPGQPQEWAQASFSFKPEDCAPEEVSAFALSPSDARLAVGVRNEVRVYDAASLALLYILKGLFGKLGTIRWHPTNEKVLVAGSSYISGGPARGLPKSKVPPQLLRIWDLDDLASHGMSVEDVAEDAARAALAKLATGHSIETDADAISEHATLTRTFATALDEITVCRDVRAGRTIAASLASSHPFYRTGTHLFCITDSDKNTVSVYELASRKESFVLRGHTDFLTWVGTSPDDALIGTSSEDQTVRI
jgi:WD40 repeat protein